MRRRPRFTDQHGDARDEIEFHLEMREQELREAGLDPEEARREARRRFGDVPRLLRLCRRLDRRLVRHWQRVDLWSEMGSDVQVGLRRMRSAPGFTLVALLTLTLGVGATTALFSVLDAVLLRPLPYERPQELLALTSENAARGYDGMPLPPGVLLRLRELDSLQGLGAYSASRLTHLGEDEPRRVTALRVTPDLLSVLGREPALGRGLLPEDTLGDGERVCLISDGLWRARFSGDTDVVGRTLRLDGDLYRVVGILPRDLDYPGSALGQAEVWLPLGLAGQEEEFSSWFLEGVARRRSGVDLETTRAELDHAAATLADRLPFGEGWTFRVTPLEDTVIGHVRPALLVLFAAVVVVLLIACANLANLLIARTLERDHEMQTRLALGAGRARLVRQLLVENTVLALAGGAAGLGLAAILTPSLLRLGAAELPRGNAVGIDGRVVLFALAATAVAALLSGLLPALQAARLGRGREGSLRTTGRVVRGSTPLRQLLVVAEIALAVVLLVGAGLLLRSLDRLLAVDPGFSSEGLLTMTLERPRSRDADPQQWRAFFERVEERVSALPGVRRTGLVSALPSRGSFMMDRLRLAETSAPDDEGPTVAIDVVSPGFLRALGIPLLEGRDFGPADVADGEVHVIVNERVASRLFPGESAVGKRLLGTDDETTQTIVGVVGSVKQYGLREDAPLHVYLNQTQQPARRMSLVVRTDIDPLVVAPAVKALVHEIDPTQPVVDIHTMDAVLAESWARDRFNTLLMSLFALLAASLAAIGVYGVIAHSVSRRSQELGVRAALGAQRGDLFLLVLGSGGALAAAGVTLGLLGALSLGRFLEGLLFDVTPADPATLATIGVAVLVIALLACLAPARRATRVDPASALRSE